MLIPAKCWHTVYNFAEEATILAIINITDGKFVIDSHVGKNYFNIGGTAVLKVDNINILVCEKNGPFYDQAVYKNARARYAYEPVADKVVLVGHPGFFFFKS